jgi:autophagy-related protein 9
LSVLTTPFVLWFSLPNCSDRIVDFFRENTVHVDAVGYICTYSQFVDFLHVPGKVGPPHIVPV